MRGAPVKIKRLFPQAVHGPVAVFYDHIAAPGFAEYHKEVVFKSHDDVARELVTGSVLDVQLDLRGACLRLSPRGNDR